MQIKATCPNCRKRARFTPDEVGLPAVCAACGTRYVVPPPVPLSDEEIPIATPVSASALRGRLSPWWALMGGVVIGLVIALGTVAAILAAKPPAAPLVAAVGPHPPAAQIAPRADETRAAVPSPRPTSSENRIPLNALASTDPVPVELPRRIAATQPAAPAIKPKPAPPAGPPARAKRPEPRPIPTAPDDLTDARIGDAITKGTRYLIANLDNSKHQVRGITDEKAANSGGIDALVVYALMQSGQAVSDPRLNIKNKFLVSLIDRLKQFPVEEGAVTYARGLRATALAVYDRPEDRPTLRIDSQWLLKAQRNGAYSYDHELTVLGQRAAFRPDNSNSQYGLLGVWSAADAGIEVPTGYWAQVEAHWNQSQLHSGTWPYQDAEAQGRALSMTCAGVASLLVCHDWLVGPKFASPDVGREPFSPNLKKGLEWLETDDHAVDLDQAEFWGYTLYGIERVGLASGFKYLGKHDWYRELARKVLAAQHSDGSWGQQGSMAFPSMQLVDTSYALLFLARGRHPILMNKLRFDGYWANRPRDLSNLSRYASRQIERPLNWQVVPLSNGWMDWMDSPILYIASHAAPSFSDADCENLRDFVLAGGMIFTQADGNDPAFDTFARQLAARLFPTHPMADVPADHPIFSTVFKLDPKPKLQMVANGARLLMLHSPVDISRSWELREQVTHKMPFQFGVNLFEYAAGKREPRNRLDSPLIAPLSQEFSYSIRVARLSYKGNWDPEPYAWTRFSRWFERQTGYGLTVKDLPISSLKPGDADVAVLTGSDRFVPTAPEADSIRAYVSGGGVLLVDRCGGTGGFEENVRTHLFANAFPNGFLRALPRSHPILNAGRPGMEDLTQTRLRGYAIEQLGDAPNSFPSTFTAGQGHVIFTPLDLTCGLLDTNTWGIVGYAPDYAQSLTKNILLWTMDGQKDD